MLSAPHGGALVEKDDRAEFVDPAELSPRDVRPAGLKTLLQELASGARPAVRYLGDLTVEEPAGGG